MAIMSRLSDKLPGMMALAAERTEDARVQLASQLADVMLDESMQLNLREEELINELVDDLLRARTPVVRAQLIKRFADVKRMPRRLAFSLANDKIDVANDVLQNCPSLSDGDLVTIVETQTRDHAAAVARRKSISEAVADALVVTGDVRVMQLVAENLGAQLGPKAIAVLTDAARFAADLREPLLNRTEMTADAASRLYWWVSQDLRRVALNRFNIPSGQIDQALAGTIDQLLGYYEIDKANDESMTSVANWLTERQAVTPQILPQVLRLGHFRLFNILVGRMTALPLNLVDLIVNETGGRGLAVICRAIGIEKSQFVSIFLLSRGSRGGDQIVHPRELSNALASFDRINTSIARDMLNSWKIDPSYFTQPHDQMAQA